MVEDGGGNRQLPDARPSIRRLLRAATRPACPRQVNARSFRKHFSLQKGIEECAGHYGNEWIAATVTVTPKAAVTVTVIVPVMESVLNVDLNDGGQMK